MIPGSGEGLKDRDYGAVLKMYRSLGYDPEFVPIDWNYKIFDDYVEQIKNLIPRSDLEKSLLSGFSWGAMLALIVSAQYANPRKLVLCSLSPYFAENLPHTKESWLKWAGKRRVKNLANYSIRELAPSIQSPTVLFIGDAERKKYGDKIDMEANKLIKNSKYIVIGGGVSHDVADPKYIAAIKNELG